MKKNLKTASFIALFAMIFAAAENVSAQDGELIIVGGYKSMAVDDKQIINATNFAIKEIGEKEEMDLTLVSILKAQYQAGQTFNYKVFFETAYLDGGDNYPLCINADVSLNMKKEYKLISWDSVVCPEKTDK